MPKKRSNRLSTYGRKTVSVESNILDPDTNVIGDEQTAWWHNLEENTSMRYSLHNERDETTKHLNPSSKLNSSQSTAEWWKNLETSDSEPNVSIRNAAIVKHNVLETSTSESERERNVKKRKTSLRIANRKSISNVFLNALNDTRSSSQSRISHKERERSTDASVKNISERTSHGDKQDSPNMSLTVLKSRTNIFNKKRRKEEKDENIFQNVLTDDALDDIDEIYAATEDKSTINQNINKTHTSDQSITKSRRSLLKNNVDPSLKSSTSQVRSSALKDNSVNKIIRSTDESDESTTILKPKPRFLKQVRKSMGENAFQNILANNDNISLSPRNVSQEIDTKKSRSSNKSLFSSSKTSVNKSRDKADTMYRSTTKETANTSIRRSTRLLSPNAAEKHSLNVAVQRTQDNIEQNTTNSSSDDSEFRISNPVSKPKSRFLERFRNKSPVKNLFEELFQDDDITNTKKNNSPIERNAIKQGISQSRTSLVMEKNIQSDEEKNVKEQSNDFSLKVSPNDEGSISEKDNVQLTNKVFEKEISPNLKSKGKVSKTSKKQKRASTIISSIDTMSINNTKSNVNISDSYPATDREQDTNISITRSKLNQAKELIVTISSRNEPDTSKNATKRITELHKKSSHSNAEVEENSDMSEDLEISTYNISQVQNSTRNSNNISINKEASTTLLYSNTVPVIEELESEKGEIAENTNASLLTKTSQHNTSLLKGKTNNETLNRRTLSKSFVNLSIDNAKKKQEVSLKQNSRNKSQSYHSTSIKALSNNASPNINKITSSRTMRIDDFFKVSGHKENPSCDRHTVPSEIFLDTQKLENVKKELEKRRMREIAAMKVVEKEKFPSKMKKTKMINTQLKQPTKKPTKIVDKAFLVNGKVYKVPRLPRPKHWVTDRLYKFLWKCMEPRYKLATRVRSEKFIKELSNVVSFIEKRTKYDRYKAELKALMKEMARLGIIRTSNDFYHFARDFFPYEIRVKVIPMLLPGNEQTIPYNPEKLHTPLLGSK